MGEQCLMPGASFGFAELFSTLSIPADRGLLGSAFYEQAWIVDPGANPAGAAWTNAAEGLVGVK